MLILRTTLGDESVQPCGRCDVCTQSPHIIGENTDQITAISNWLTEQTVPIKAVRTNNIAEGIAILNGKLRSQLFAEFMKQRMCSVGEQSLGLSEGLLELIKKHLKTLASKHHFTAVIPIPSRTWVHSKNVAIAIAKILNVSALLDYLFWLELPPARQGELLNNDQRHFNIDKKMFFDHSQSVPKGVILLLDDYTGSGATIDEAARVLRKNANLKQEIIPFTIASIKWKLGQSGMV
jgi:hypothetical protein